MPSAANKTLEKKNPRKVKAKREKNAQDLLSVRRTGGIAGLTKKQRATFKGLGLARPGRTVLLEDTNSVRGMVNQMIHWLDVTVIPASESAKAIETHRKAREKAPRGYHIVGK